MRELERIVYQASPDGKMPSNIDERCTSCNEKVGYEGVQPICINTACTRTMLPFER